MHSVPDTIIPAAGASQRMGQWKLALPWRGGWVIDAVVACAHQAGSRAVVVAHDNRLIERFRSVPSVVPVWNPAPEQGMFSSIKCGVAELQSDWAFVLPADMPLVPAAVFGMLRDAVTHAAPARAFRPVYDGKPGHPVLLPPAVLKRVRALPPDATMRAALEGVPMVALPSQDPGVTIDLDTIEQYRRYR